MINELRLKAGKFYKSKYGDIWCCFSVNKNNESHRVAYCVNVYTHLIEHFYIDGRYDVGGSMAHCLIEEINVNSED